MKHNKKSAYSLDELTKTLKPFDNYELKNHDDEAKLALKAFFEKYKDIELDKDFHFSKGMRNYYFSILGHLPCGKR